jgi:hypothetical protein
LNSQYFDTADGGRHALDDTAILHRRSDFDSTVSRVLAQPLEGNPLRGRQMPTTLCSSCHRVLPMTLPDKGDPPSFQSIADLPSTTELSLKVFLRSNHRNMPNPILSEAESDDVIALRLVGSRTASCRHNAALARNSTTFFMKCLPCQSDIFP